MGKVTAGEEKTGKVRDKSGEDSKNLVQKSADENSKNLAGDGGNSGGNREVSVKNGGAAEKKRGFGLTNRGFCIAMMSVGTFCTVAMTVLVWFVLANINNNSLAIYEENYSVSVNIYNIKIDKYEILEMSGIYWGSATMYHEAHYYYCDYESVFTVKFFSQNGMVPDALFASRLEHSGIETSCEYFYLNEDNTYDMVSETVPYRSVFDPFILACYLDGNDAVLSVKLPGDNLNWMGYTEMPNDYDVHTSFSVGSYKKIEKYDVTAHIGF
jgi:hypothetical protein